MFSYSTLKQVIICAAIASSFYLAYVIILTLGAVSNGSISPDGAIRLVFLLSSFVLPILGGWVTFRLWAALPMGFLAVFMNTLSLIVSGRKVFVLFYFLYGGLYGLLQWYEKKNQNQIFLDKVEIEKNSVDKNQTDLKLKKIKEEVDIFFQKYTNYYGLREVAERFATTLSLEKIAELVVAETRHFIPRGDSYLLYLSELEDTSLSLVASYSAREDEKIKTKKGDFFDLWVLKNRKHLLISDTEKDFRFDTLQVSETMSVKSLIIAPLVSEGRVLGTFRINSSQINSFVIDDLRILDFICGLASSAIANALLYQKTEELAIRDSLTGLYVQRYFKERLKEEHRRALLTNAPLSVLMCDLDRFKNYNDTFGHAAGDMILLSVSKVLLNEVRDHGIVARYGGEELAVILPRFSKQEAIDLAQRIREKVETQRLEIRREPTKITLSIGVGTMPEDTLEREELIRKADQNLYVAKRSGRNQVCS